MREVEQREDRDTCSEKKRWIVTCSVQMESWKALSCTPISCHELQRCTSKANMTTWNKILCED